jgi:hypothetical protein
MPRNRTRLRLLSADSETNRVLFRLHLRRKLDHSADGITAGIPAGVMCDRREPRWHSVIPPLQDDPDDEQQSANDADLYP